MAIMRCGIVTSEGPRNICALARSLKSGIRAVTIGPATTGGLLLLFVTGPGKWSLDRWLANRQGIQCSDCALRLQFTRWRFTPPSFKPEIQIP